MAWRVFGRVSAQRSLSASPSHTVLPLLFGFGGSVIGAAAAFWSLGATMILGAFGIQRSNKNIASDRGMPDEEKAIERSLIDAKKQKIHHK